jgi:hypothetical protein
MKSTAKPGTSTFRTKWVRQFHRVLPGGHLAFLHRFEERRLGLRRGAVDFVRQHDVGENRPTDEAELTLAVGRFVEHRGSGNVRRHQVWGELDALEGRVQDLADARDHERLGESGHADEEAVAAGEDGGEDLLDDFALPDDDAARDS